MERRWEGGGWGRRKGIRKAVGRGRRGGWGGEEWGEWVRRVGGGGESTMGEGGGGTGGGRDGENMEVGAKRVGGERGRGE